MQDQEPEPEPDNGHESENENKVTMFFAFVCFLYMLSSQLSTLAYHEQNLLALMMSNTTEEVPASICMDSFQGTQLEGKWVSSEKGKFLWAGKGIFSMRVEDRGSGDYMLYLVLNNGQYIDDGTYEVEFRFEGPDWETMFDYEQQHVTVLQKNVSAKLHYHFHKDIILHNVNSGEANDAEVIFTLKQKQKKIFRKIELHTEEGDITLRVTGKKSQMLGNLVFAIVLFIVGYKQFCSVMNIIKSFIENESNPAHFSFSTLLIATMWDATMCVLAFSQSFHYSDSFVLFLIPALMFCLLCTNLELRFMLEVYQKNNADENVHRLLCQFNAIAYGCLLFTFPLLILTNVSSYVFVALSFIFVPQIYTNALNGIRPELTSRYYIQFLLLRFLLLLYLRCCPFNSLQLEPNYLLGAACLLILAGQFVLLWIQKVYGPKAVVPSFLLPAVFDYHCEEAEPEEECVICLCPLNNNSPVNQTDEQSFPPIMRTPCQHKYHGSCLTQWMKVKLQCPQCRTKLPPFE